MIVRGSTPRDLSGVGKLLVLSLLAALPLTPGPGRTAAPPRRETPAETADKSGPPQVERRIETAARAAAKDTPDEPTRYGSKTRVLVSTGSFADEHDPRGGIADAKNCLSARAGQFLAANALSDSLLELIQTPSAIFE